MTDQIFESKQSPVVYGFAYGLWFLSVILSVVVFMAVREMFMRTYVRFFPWNALLMTQGQGGLSLVNVLISILLGMMVIIIIVGGFEYQHRYKGTTKAWQMLARALAIECGFLLLALYI